MKPVLFLDFDGVLNTMTTRVDAFKLRDIDHLDRERIDRVNRIVERTGCLVVISSSWRLLYGKTPRSALQKILSTNGATFDVYDVTPHHVSHDSACRGPGHGEECARGHEIQAWIAGERDRLDVGPIAIVDDSADMGHLLPRLVRTNDETGLQDEHVERLVALLTETKTEAA